MAEESKKKVAKNSEEGSSKSDKKRLVLPKYMRLAKGGMWRDTEGPYASGKTVYAFNKVMVGRNPKDKTVSEPPQDKFGNKNLIQFGFIDQELPWYIDLTDIPKENLGRIIIAYNAGILVKADPNTPPVQEKNEIKTDWKVKQDGALVFDGSNVEMFKKLQNYSFDQLKKFVNESPLTEQSRDNLLDLFDYEKRGHNPLARPRFEVINLLRKRLREFGPGMSSIRRND